MFHRLGGRLAGFRPERAAELTRTQPGGLGKLLHGQVVPKASLRVGKRRLDAIGLGLKLEKRRVLRLASRTLMTGHQLLGNRTRNFGTDVLLNHCQGKLDACRHTGGSPYRVVDDEDPILLDRDVRVAGLELPRHQPMRGRATSVQQAASAKMNAAVQIDAIKSVPPHTTSVS